MDTIVFLVTLTYIFWGPLLGVGLAIKIGRKLACDGGLGNRFTGSVMGSALVTALFTPASMGTEGFGWLIPLPLLLAFSEHTYFLPGMIPVTFTVAFLIILNASK